MFTGCQGPDLRPAGVAPILLFNGRGTSPGDAAALEKILSREHLGYSILGTRQLNHLTELEIRKYRLLIIPGGNFEQIGNKLTLAAAVNIRGAVRSGLNYLGICAGVFFAGNSPYNDLNLTSDVRFEFYAAGRGIRKRLSPLPMPPDKRWISTGKTARSSPAGARLSPSIWMAPHSWKGCTEADG